MRYLLLEERAMPREALRGGGIAAQLVHLEQAGDQEAIQAAVGTFLAGLPEEIREALTAALTLLVTNSPARNCGTSRESAPAIARQQQAARGGRWCK